MKSRLHLAALAAAMIGAFTVQGVLAAEPSPEPKARSSASREDVRKEGKEAHQSGAMPHGEAAKSEAPKATGKSAKSRKAVQKEGEIAHKDGTMPHGEAAKSEAPK